MNQNQQVCTHCGGELPPRNTISEVSNDGELCFCCLGCQSVYHLIHKYDLENFYELSKTADSPLGPVKISSKKYLYLDSEQFQSEFVIEKQDSHEIFFYIEGIHCLACLWLLEKLPEIESGILESKLNFEQGVLQLKFQQELPLSRIASLIASFGYTPHPLKDYESLNKLKQIEQRLVLKRIAWAFFSMGNIMLWSWSVYLGAEGPWQTTFDILSSVAFLPILLFSAIPFYQQAWSAIKQKRVSIDIPIVLALILGSLLGYYGLYREVVFQAQATLYFDTLSALVFLLLSSRYLLMRSTQKSIKIGQIIDHYFQEEVDLLTKDGVTVTHPKLIAPEDEIQIHPQKTIPVDGLLLTKEAYIDNSLLTGESKPVKVLLGQVVHAGSINLSDEMRIKVTSDWQSSRLGKILAELELGWGKRSKIVTHSQQYSDYLVGFLLIYALGFFLYSLTQTSFTETFETTLSIIIITCPCALGLTIPLSFSLTLDLLAKNGIIVKKEQTLEQLFNLKKIFFDKTGTLTQGEMKLAQETFHSEDLNREQVHSLLWQLESKSQHPIAQSLKRYLQTCYPQFNPKIEIENIQLVPGKGIKADFYHNSLFLGQWEESTFSEGTEIGLTLNEKLIWSGKILDDLRADVPQILTKLKVPLALLSGDHQKYCDNLAKKLGIAEVYAAVSPEQKAQIVENSEHCLMVGDGANDALALSKAPISIAMGSGLEISLKASDMILRDNKLSLLPKLLQASKLLKAHLTRTFVFAFSFNLVGIVLASLGKIDPLMAAILMPTSSFIVLAMALYYAYQSAHALKVY